MKMNFINRNLSIIILHAVITIFLALFAQASLASIGTYKGRELGNLKTKPLHL
ncbi:MAG: hypothetical protein ABSB79_07740 [Syntrophales bacterium]|jgi:hypothetical protein